jgi:hypothetical protein
MEGEPASRHRLRLMGIVFTGFSARLIDLQVTKTDGVHIACRSEALDPPDGSLRIAE